MLGGGESGVGAAILAKDKGMDVFLSDMGAIAPKYAEQLDAEGIVWEQGRHTESLILTADEVVKSPGIPPHSEKAAVPYPGSVHHTGGASDPVPPR